MGQIKTIKDISQRLWYRLFKVLYIFTIGFIFVLVSFSLFTDIGAYFLNYSLGEQYTKEDLLALPLDLNSNILDICGISSNEMDQYLNDVLNDNYDSYVFELKKAKVNEFGLGEALVGFFLLILVIIAFTEIVKRAIYYILIGKLRPNKN